MRLGCVLVILLLWMYSSHGWAPLYHSPTPHEYSGIYSVVLKKSAPLTSREYLIRSIRGISQNNEFKLIAKSHKTHLGFTARLSKNIISLVVRSNLVSYVQEDHAISSGQSSTNCYTEDIQECTQSTTNWNLDSLDGSGVLDSCLKRPHGLTGKSISVYVMDTGIMYEHTQFEGRARYPGFDIVDQYFSEDHKGEDTHGHGTSVSGVIGGRDTGVAPGVEMFSVRILKSDISGSWGMFADGIEQILSHRELQRLITPCIVSASVFSEMHHSAAGWRYTLINSLRKLIDAGCVFVTIAGNDAKSACEYLPANLTLPIVVGGSTPAQTVMRISNYGPCIDLFAPGKNIPSASISCSTCTDTYTGTSYAGPHVTGIAAVLLEKCPTLTQDQIKQLLIKLSLKGVLNIPTDHFPNDTPNLLAQMPDSICECRSRD